MPDPQSPNPHSLLPLTSTVFHILLVLADKARHGYAIMKGIGELNQELVKMGPGTILDPHPTACLVFWFPCCSSYPWDSTSTRFRVRC
jgi:hypothetical protein